MLHVSHLPQMLVSLFALVTYAVGLGGVARTQFVKKMGQGLVLPALTLFATVLYFSILLVCDARIWLLIAIPASLIAWVFFLGSAIVVNQDARYTNGVLRVRRHGLVYKLLYEWAEVDESKTYSLCGLSWLGAFSAIGKLVLFYLVIPLGYLVSQVAMLVFGILGFMVSAQNPIRPMIGTHAGFTSKGNKRCWETLYAWDTIPLSPALFAGIVGLVMLYVRALTGHVSHGAQLGTIIGTALVALTGLVIGAALLIRYAERQKTDSLGHETFGPAPVPVSTPVRLSEATLLYSGRALASTIQISKVAGGTIIVRPAVQVGHGIAVAGSGIAEVCHLIASVAMSAKKKVCPIVSVVDDLEGTDN